MFAVNVITKRSVYILVVCLFFLHAAGGGKCDARTKVDPAGFSASGFDKITEKQGPTTGNIDDNDFNGVTDVDVVGIIKADQDGKSLMLPGSVYCDTTENETYVVDAGHVIIYGENLFPTTYIGYGRGIQTATGVHVDKDGKVYVLQAPHYDKPARISIYNAALLPVRDINLSEIEGTSIPKRMAIGSNGNIYVSFTAGIRGLLVLDKDGNYSHWLRPMDLVLDRSIVAQTQAEELEEEGEVAEEIEEPDFDISELAPQLIPKGSDQVFEVFDEPGLGPVQVSDVQVDSDGNIYLLSIETSKVYIYNPAEEFLYSFGEKGGSTGKLSQPQQLLIDEKKKAIFIVDATRHAILIYDLSGRYMHEFGGMGNRPGWFQYPHSLALNKKGHLVVGDRFNRRVQFLDVHFEYKFPLFQVPFVFDPNDIFQPRPIRTSEHYGPGFDEGQAYLDLTPEQEEILLILDEAGDLI